LQKDSGGFLRLSTDAIIHDFAQDVPVKEARLIAATQQLKEVGFRDVQMKKLITQHGARNHPGLL